MFVSQEEEEEEPNLDPYVPTNRGDESGRGTPNSLGSSGEWFDANHELPPTMSLGAAAFPSPSVSVSTIGGDPTDVEEENIHHDTEDMHGELHFLGYYVQVSNSSILMVNCYSYIIMLFPTLNFCTQWNACYVHVYICKLECC